MTEGILLYMLMITNCIGIYRDYLSLECLCGGEYKSYLTFQQDINIETWNNAAVIENGYDTICNLKY